jgi:DNA (cytosine-5)-methyltransferase 1
MRVLNLYSGIGGNRKLWQDVEVTAVELNEEIADIYREHFPDDTMIVADAHEYLLKHYKEFDFIWSSPPCQSHSRMMKATRYEANKYPDMKLYQEIIFLDNFFKGKWIIENVKPYYEPLIRPATQIGRHLIWCNFSIRKIEVENHKNFISMGGVADSEKLKKWLGFEYKGNIYYEGNHEPCQVLRNCVIPDLGLYILEQAQGIIRQEKHLTGSLFV